MESAQGAAQQPPAGARRLLRAARVVHPFPTIANALAVALFAAVAVRGVPPVGPLLRLVAAMLGVQCAIGAANDAMDTELDRAAKPWKPIVAGALSRRRAWTVAAVAGTLGCGLALTFGAGAWLLALGGLACGLAYDFGLKRTPFSVLTYVLALPLLPLWVWVSLGRFSGALLWAYPLGALIGVALYLGNTAPDIATDSAAGVRGAAHRLGLWRSLVAAWGSMALAIALGVALASPAGYDERLVLVGAAIGLVCLGGAVALSLKRQEYTTLVRAWGLLIAAGVAFGLGWLAAAP